MCRLFGFRSVINSQVHTSLVSADNALVMQSNMHPDGWGVAYFVAGAPHLVKSSGAAIDDQIFQRVSGVVSSQTVLAHIRKSTIGENNILNTHPFQHGNWVFAHNGNIKNFDKVRDLLLAGITPELKRFILGKTDSEIIFYFILTHLQNKIDLTEKECPIDLLMEAVKESIRNLIAHAGDFAEKDDCGEDETYFTFILTNGETMVAHQGGKNLYYSTYKSKCKDRDSCPSFTDECEAATKTGYVNHMIFSSEPLSGDNIWISMDRGQLIGVDSHMKLTIV